MGTRTLNGRRLGWKPDLPDFRDRLYRIPSKLGAVAPLPSVVDWTPFLPPVFDQGDLGSCTGHGTAEAFYVDLKKQGLGDWIPSRLWIYYQARVLEDSAAVDDGAEIRDCIAAIAKVGVAHEALWPYDPATFATPPNSATVADAFHHLALQYTRVYGASAPSTIYHLRHCLATYRPVIVGFSVYQSFETAPNGDVPMPSTTEELLGGHCVLVIGYNDKLQRFTFRNSWSATWGANGNGTLPYAYLGNPDLASDFWAVTVVS